MAAHRNVAPVEFENRIKGEGVVTNFGPIKSISLTLEDDWVARTISEDAAMNNYVRKKLILILLIHCVQFAGASDLDFCSWYTQINFMKFIN